MDDYDTPSPIDPCTDLSPSLRDESQSPQFAPPQINANNIRVNGNSISPIASLPPTHHDPNSRKFLSPVPFNDTRNPMHSPRNERTDPRLRAPDLRATRPPPYNRYHQRTRQGRLDALDTVKCGFEDLLHRVAAANAKVIQSENDIQPKLAHATSQLQAKVRHLLHQQNQTWLDTDARLTQRAAALNSKVDLLDHRVAAIVNVVQDLKKLVTESVVASPRTSPSPQRHSPSFTHAFSGNLDSSPSSSFSLAQSLSRNDPNHQFSPRTDRTFNSRNDRFRGDLFSFRDDLFSSRNDQFRSDRNFDRERSCGPPLKRMRSNSFVAVPSEFEVERGPMNRARSIGADYGVREFNFC